ncbi:MAG: DUF86 domain-containing protein [Candidatus Liptonbacteria bacterium]|nr:DUF86 domain-containing protein [Candidatus Liptonbacteria bacterium]
MAEPTDRIVAYLRDILENIWIVEQFIRGVTPEDFYSDLEKQFAVARALEIIGEASAKLSEDFRAKYTEVDWRGLSLSCGVSGLSTGVSFCRQLSIAREYAPSKFFYHRSACRIYLKK